MGASRLPPTSLPYFSQYPPVVLQEYAQGIEYFLKVVHFVLQLLVLAAPYEHAWGNS